MHRFKWTKAHEVFLPEADAEHRHLYHLAEELETAVMKTDSARVCETLRALTAGMEDHFSHEERQMRSTHYPSFNWHKQQHDTLRKRIAHLAERVENGDADAPVLLLEVLEGWLKDHTGLTDRMLCAYLRNYEREAARGRQRRVVT